MLVTTIFSFFHNVFYPPQTKFNCWATSILSSAYVLNLDHSKILWFGKKLNHVINPLPDDKILVWSKLKGFADDKFNVATIMISVCDRVEKIVGKGEYAGYQHVLFFPAMFSKAFYFGSLKLGIVW